MQLQQRIGITLRNLLAHVWDKIQLIEPVACPSVVGERVVHREHHPVVAKRLARQLKRSVVKVATRGHPEMLAEVVANRLVQMAGERRERVLEATEMKR